MLEKIQKEVGEAHPFDINVTLIDGNPELEREYGEQVPVIHINGQAHDFFRVDPAKFKKAIAALHPHQ